MNQFLEVTKFVMPILLELIFTFLPSVTVHESFNLFVDSLHLTPTYINLSAMKLTIVVIGTVRKIILIGFWKPNPTLEATEFADSILLRLNSKYFLETNSRE